VWPPVASAASPTRIPRITLGHQARAEAGGGALSVPLVAHGRAVGAVCLQWANGAPPLPAELLQPLAALAGPVLALLQARQQPWPQRARAAARHAWAAPGQPRQRAWRRAGLVLGALLLMALCVPVGLQVGGQARLEGAVQRVLTAPADGFVQQVHARPGDHVRAGQALLELADQDLQLARQRWQSQLAQHLDALAAAQARADRGQLVQQQSQAYEAQAELDLVEQQLQRARLVAPFDAVVVQGDLSQQLGMPVKLGAELMTLAPAGAYRVIVAVDERDIAHIALGQPGTLALSALPWDTLALRVTRISPVALAVAGRNVFEVEATLLQPRADGLRPGLQGQAQISAGRASTLWRWSHRAIEAVRMGLWAWMP
jgi:multidrug efflux pump subunit AcrA (membrane-fusion protein)